ncbi:MAG: hypothetical protein P4L53_08080 [Candidatus Obscuribacterales bacterium]|nr:hypothetical protein [Candidatus Obscuribacterales bacterium]
MINLAIPRCRWRLSHSSKRSLKDSRLLDGLNQYCSVSGATTVLQYENFDGATSNLLSMHGERFSHMADAVIFLTADSDGACKRTLSVIKQRASAHFLGVKEYKISGSGMNIE